MIDRNRQDSGNYHGETTRKNAGEDRLPNFHHLKYKQPELRILDKNRRISAKRHESPPTSSRHQS